MKFCRVLSEPHGHRAQPATGMRELALQVTYGQAACPTLPNMLLNIPEAIVGASRSMQVRAPTPPPSFAGQARHGIFRRFAGPSARVGLRLDLGGSRLRTVLRGVSRSHPKSDTRLVLLPWVTLPCISS